MYNGVKERSGFEHWLAYVTFVEDAQATDVTHKGRIRYNTHFEPKGGTNVNFVELLADTAYLSVLTNAAWKTKPFLRYGVTVCAIAASHRALANRSLKPSVSCR